MEALHPGEDESHGGTEEVSRFIANEGGSEAAGLKQGRIKELESEVRELKRANEILLTAGSFFARELDPRLPW